VDAWRGCLRYGDRLFGQFGQQRGQFFGGQAPFKAGSDTALAIDEEEPRFGLQTPGEIGVRDAGFALGVGQIATVGHGFLEDGVLLAKRIAKGEAINLAMNECDFVAKGALECAKYLEAGTTHGGATKPGGSKEQCNWFGLGEGGLEANLVEAEVGVGHRDQLADIGSRGDSERVGRYGLVAYFGGNGTLADGELELGSARCGHASELDVDFDAPIAGAGEGEIGDVDGGRQAFAVVGGGSSTHGGFAVDIEVEKTERDLSLGIVDGRASFDDADGEAIGADDGLGKGKNGGNGGIARRRSATTGAEGEETKQTKGNEVFHGCPIIIKNDR
jgi:hypothetical protein